MGKTSASGSSEGFPKQVANMTARDYMATLVEEWNAVGNNTRLEMDGSTVAEVEGCEGQAAGVGRRVVL